jgi:hypothetical protein
MLHILYILAFTVIALVAIGNLIRSLVVLGTESRRPYGTAPKPVPRSVPHPELLDAAGQPIQEPLLVMRSLTVEDARQQLDALYQASPGGEEEKEGDRP